LNLTIVALLELANQVDEDSIFVNDVNDYTILNEDILQGVSKNEPTLFYDLQVNLDDCKLLLT
jgi:hypothetical protein